MVCVLSSAASRCQSTRISGVVTALSHRLNEADATFEQQLLVLYFDLSHMGKTWPIFLYSSTSLLPIVSGQK